jgi:hypothetical protein
MTVIRVGPEDLDTLAIRLLEEYEAMPEEPQVETGERMLHWFQYEHLPEVLQQITRPFNELAHQMVGVIKAGPERTVALRKLLEAMDAAMRARLRPGG